MSSASAPTAPAAERATVPTSATGIRPRPAPGRPRSANEMGPRPAPGRPRSAKRGVGFTLVEILVVVGIVGVVLAVAAVNLFPSDAEVAKREAGYVALAIEKARDSAWFGGRPRALTFDEGRVRQWRLAPHRPRQADAGNDRPLRRTRPPRLYLH